MTPPSTIYMTNTQADWSFLRLKPQLGNWGIGIDTTKSCQILMLVLVLVLIPTSVIVLLLDPMIDTRLSYY